MKLLATGVCNWDSPDILLDMNAEWLTECLKGAVTKPKTKVLLFDHKATIFYADRCIQISFQCKIVCYCFREVSNR
jgi:hypothetical protein